MPRPIDIAMAERRPDKEAIRSLWVELVQEVNTRGADASIPLYFTLPGALGLDVQRMIDARIVRLNENGSIHDEDGWKIVAYEGDPEAYLSVRERFIGLQLFEARLQDLIRSEGDFAWPVRDKATHCRARVVNFDLNGALTARRESAAIVFPVLRWIGKIAKLHTKGEPVDWTLCLTLSAETPWDGPTCTHVLEFLRESFRDAQFADGCRQILSKRLFDELRRARRIAIGKLTDAERQAMLTVLVPKQIIVETSGQHWSITVEQSLAYGGHNEHAAMMTWVIRFAHDPRVAARPDAAYTTALHTILAAAGRVEPNGAITATLGP